MSSQPEPTTRQQPAGATSPSEDGINRRAAHWREPADAGRPLAGGRVSAGATRPKIAFVCSPAGQQWTGMARMMFQSEDAFRKMLLRCDREFARLGGTSVIDEIFSTNPRFDLPDPLVPIIFANQVSIAAWLIDQGLEPDMVVGSSVGEFAAAVISGILTLSDGVRLAFEFGRLAQQLVGHGSMIAVDLSREELRPFLCERYSSVAVASHSGPRSTVLAGDRSEMATLADELKTQNVNCVRVPIPCAAHSPAMDPILEDLRHALKGLTPKPGHVPMISSVTGLPAAWQDIDSNYFAKNARQPVLLFEAIERTLAEGVDILVEVGANPVLLSALQQTADALGKPVTVIGTMSRGEDDRVGLVNAAVELSRLTGGRADRRLGRRSERNGGLWPGRGDDG